MLTIKQSTLTWIQLLIVNSSNEPLLEGNRVYIVHKRTNSNKLLLKTILFFNDHLLLIFILLTFYYLCNIIVFHSNINRLLNFIEQTTNPLSLNNRLLYIKQKLNDLMFHHSGWLSGREISCAGQPFSRPPSKLLLIVCCNNQQLIVVSSSAIIR